MRDMKDSGIEWVGNVPSSWSVKPIRALFREITEKNKSGKEKTALKFTYGAIIRKSDFNADEDNYVADTILNYTIVESGAIILNGLNLNFDFVSQRIGLVKEKGIITSAYTAMMPYLSIIESRFATYVLKSYDNCKAFHNMGGGVRKILNYDELKRNYMAYPSFNEQQCISDFLDRKCAEIDSLAADIQSQIDILQDYKKSVITEAVTKGLNPDVEMKDSGIEWIGMMPNDWKMTDIKYLYKVIAGSTPDSTNPEYWDGEICWITPADYSTERKYIQDGKKYITQKGYDSCSTTIIPIGSIIFSKRAPIGTVSINTHELCTNQGCLACINIASNVSNEFYFYVFSIARESFELLGAGTTFKEISANSFLNFVVPFPSKETQQQIVNYLVEKCSEIDKTIAEKREQLEALATYKKSLIYEYVTGKKEVPNNE